MKCKIFALLLCGAMTMQAADDVKTYSGRSKDPVYIQFYGGINKSANENLPWTEFSQYPWAGGLFLGVGSEFSPLWGWRAAFRYNHNKSRNVQECESPDTWGWKNIGLFADLTFDLTEWLTPNAKPREGLDYRRWNVKAFAGVGGAHTYDFDEVPLSYTDPYNSGSQNMLGFRGGLTATYRFARNWRVGTELSHNWYADNFNGVVAESPLDGRTNLKVGITYLFAKAPKRKKTKVVPVARDPRLTEIPYLPFVMPEPEDVKIRQLSGRAFIDFVVDRTEIKPDYRRNTEELKRITSTIDSALFDKSIEVKSIILHGYASPESPYSHNVELSLGRVRALKNYLQNHYSLPSSIFTLDNTPEDWQNLRDFIAVGGRDRVKDDIWYHSLNIRETPETPTAVLNHRDELLRVIDLQMDEDEKELLLKQVGGGEPYKWLHKYVYPGLRHTDYIIEYVVRQYPVKDARKLIYTHPDALSQEEMNRVAFSYATGSDEWLDALLIAANQAPNNHTANLNATCACIQVKRLADAKHYLKRAGISANARYLQDVISAMEGSKPWKIENERVVITNQ